MRSICLGFDRKSTSTVVFGIGYFTSHFTNADNNYFVARFVSLYKIMTLNPCKPGVEQLYHAESGGRGQASVELVTCTCLLIRLLRTASTFISRSCCSGAVGPEARKPSVGEGIELRRPPQLHDDDSPGSPVRLLTALNSRRRQPCKCVFTVSYLLLLLPTLIAGNHIGFLAVS